MTRLLHTSHFPNGVVKQAGRNLPKVLLAAVVLVIAAWPALGASSLDAPNVVEISPTLVTAGQPTASALRSLAALQFDAVIYLAPFTVPDAIAEEPALLQSQGIEFVHIPIPFARPSEAHLAQLNEALNRLRSKRVLVHCQVNMRASTLVFLHRVIVDHEAPALAYEAVTRVWSPRGPWETLMVEQLRKHAIAFEPF